MTIAITKKQQAVLDFIKKHIRVMGFPPTQKEFAKEFGWSSTNSCISFLIALEDKGYIEIMPGISRGIRVLGEKCPCCGAVK